MLKTIRLPRHRLTFPPNLRFFSTRPHAMTPPTPAARLAHLRQLMQGSNVQAYVVPSDDQHASEYVADADKRREWISGFTGSAGQRSPRRAVLTEG